MFYLYISTAKDRVRTTSRLLEIHPELKDILGKQNQDIEDEDRLIKYIKENIISTPESGLTFLYKKTKKNETTVELQSGEHNDRGENDETMKKDNTTITNDRTRTTYMKIDALYWYTKFLNKRYKKLEDMKRVVNVQSRHLEQSEIIANMFMPVPLLKRYNTLLFFLRSHQPYVEQFFIDSFKAPNILARQPDDPNSNRQELGLFKKICIEYIQPFLYLTFLICERPVDHLKLLQFSNRYGKVHSTGVGKNYSQRKIHELHAKEDIKKFITCDDYVTEDTKWTDYTRLYVDSDGKILICFIVKGRDMNIYRIQTYEPDKRIGFYLYLYATLRSTTFKKRKQTNREGIKFTHKVFSGPANGQWKNNLSDVRAMIANTNIHTKEDISKILRISINFKQFIRSVQELWFIVNIYYDDTDKNIHDGFRKPLNKPFEASRVHIKGSLAKIGFVTSSEVSLYYKGPQWIQDIKNAVEWWSNLLQIKHNTYTESYKVYDLKPMGKTIKRHYIKWHKNWITIYK